MRWHRYVRDAHPGRRPEVDRLVVADVRAESAEAMVSTLGHRGAGPAVVDVADPASLSTALAGVDVVVNCVGPFYRFGPPTLAAAIRAGVPYGDVATYPPIAAPTAPGAPPVAVGAAPVFTG